MRGLKVVVVGDYHAHENYDNKRASVIGEFAAEELQSAEHPVLLQLGDFSDVMGFNTHGSRIEMEGRRWKMDQEVTKDALHRMMKPFYRRKRKMPRRIITLGNHEARVAKFVAEHPHLEGAIGIDQLGFKRFGFETFPFKHLVNIGGVNFVHHLDSMTGAAAKISSPTNGVKNVGVSTIVGHTHCFDVVPVPYRDRRIWGIDAGCAVHKDFGTGENWSQGTAHKYWRGVLVLTDFDGKGNFNFRTKSLESLGV